MTEAEFSAKVSDLLIGRILEILAVAAGPEAQRGGIYGVTLDGDLSGDWALELNPGSVATRPADGAEVEATVTWTLTYDEVARILSGNYDFLAARKEKRIEFGGDKAAALKLMRAFDAVAKVDLLACLENPGAYLADMFRERLQADDPKKAKKPAAGVSLRK